MFGYAWMDGWMDGWKGGGQDGKNVVLMRNEFYHHILCKLSICPIHAFEKPIFFWVYVCPLLNK